MFQTSNLFRISSSDFPIRASMLSRKLSGLKSHLAQLAIERGLEFLQVRRCGAVAGRLRNQTEPSGLIEIPISSIAIGKSHFSADDGARTGDLIDFHRDVWPWGFFILRRGGRGRTACRSAGSCWRHLG